MENLRQDINFVNNDKEITVRYKCSMRISRFLDSVFSNFVEEKKAIFRKIILFPFSGERTGHHPLSSFHPFIPGCKKVSFRNYALLLIKKVQKSKNPNCDTQSTAHLLILNLFIECVL
jgi:hypothetical protein